MKYRVETSISSGSWPKETELQELCVDAVRCTLEACGATLAPDSELSILITDDVEMRMLNRQWRGIDRPTNVLSFSGGAFSPGQPAGPVLGDIVIAAETVQREADLEGKKPEHHLSHLVVHGFLHILGYDHQDEENADHMESLERRALALLDIADPYA